MDVTGIILAGGKSLRFGRNKAIEKIAGMTLIERVVKHLIPITGRIILVTDGDNKFFSEIKSAEVTTDIYPAKGPLGGIYTVLVPRTPLPILSLPVICLFLMPCCWSIW